MTGVKVPYGAATKVRDKHAYYRLIRGNGEPAGTCSDLLCGNEAQQPDPPELKLTIECVYMESRRVLTRRERIVMRMKRKGATLEEIGQRFKVKRERIRQVERAAHRKIERCLVARFRQLFGIDAVRWPRYRWDHIDVSDKIYGMIW